MTPLYAKWREEADHRESRGFLLTGEHGHLGEVVAMHDLLFHVPFFIGPLRHDSFIHALHHILDLASEGIPVERLWRLSGIACAVHDLGKAGHEFQTMIDGLEQAWVQQHRTLQFDERHRQTYRHELLSALVLTRHSTLRPALEQALGEDDFFTVVSAVLGHHVKTDRAITEDPLTQASYRPGPVRLAALSSTLTGLLARFGVHLAGLEDYRPRWLVDVGKIDAAAQDLLSDRRRETRLSAAVKWVTILSDVLGSLSDKPGETPLQARSRIEGHLLQAFGPRAPIDYEARIRNKLQLDANEIIAYNTFQQACRVDSPLLALASTGGGKTIAALSWASMRPYHRLIFTTPTTDTSNSLFRDYALAEDALKHSKAWIELARSTPSAEAHDHNEEGPGAPEMFEDSGITFSTVDQVLGVLTFARKSILWLPYLLSSQVVLDEFHSFDSKMMGWQERFLRWFPKIPTAHLSATVPRETVGRLGKWVPFVEVQEPLEPSAPRALPRYRVHVVTPEEAMRQFGPGALWITNTVARCQSVGQEVEDARVYHSRFRSRERWVIRDAVVSDLRAGAARPATRVVATQVAEMSFDVSAWLLVSEICPPGSFIQRAGRVNRAARTDRIADLYIYRPHRANFPVWNCQNSGLPYILDKDWTGTVDAWEAWFRSLEGRVLSKDDLEEAFQSWCRGQGPDLILHRNPDRICTTRMEVRENHPGIFVLLREDANRISRMPTSTPEERVHRKMEVEACAIQAIVQPIPVEALDHKPIIDGVYDSRLGLVDT